jgi:hypothetical protein
MWLWIIAALSVVVAAYVCGGRKALKRQWWMAWLYKSWLGEAAELHLFKKSESILWARWLQILGYGLTALVSMGQVDLSPLLLVLPEGWHWVVHVAPLVISAAGHIQVHLRLDTTKPIELVALPNDVPAEVENVALAAEHMKEQAIAVVEASKAGPVW